MNVYLSGEIHSNWRDEIIEGVKAKGLDIEFSYPELNHEMSDDCGDILGKEDNKFWKDNKAAKINSIRIRNGIQSADLVVVKFGEKYKQWNAAFDAGYATALSIPTIVMHPEEFGHALKEVDRAASAIAENSEQVVKLLEYISREQS